MVEFSLAPGEMMIHAKIKIVGSSLEVESHLQAGSLQRQVAFFNLCA